MEIYRDRKQNNDCPGLGGGGGGKAGVNANEYKVCFEGDKML